MSSPPESNNPFSGAGDETLCEKEAYALENRYTPLHRAFDSMATQPPEGSFLPDGNNVSQTNNTVMPANEKKKLSSSGTQDAVVKRLSEETQARLQCACKRRKLSSSGTKAALAKQLSAVGVEAREDVIRLADEFETDGPDESLSHNGKSKSPNWTKNESERLCHVIVDPRHATVVGRIYNQFDNRAELDAGKHDPWSCEFVDLFNSNDFESLIPDGCNGVTDDLLFDFDPCAHPHKRSGTILKQRWNKLRSKYTVAREKFTRSGQGEYDTFDTFTDGDDTIAYMHCVFNDLPSLEVIVRALPESAIVEVGIKEVDRAHETVLGNQQTKAKKGSADTALAAGLTGIAKSLSEPVNITFNGKNEDTELASTLLKFDISDRIAGTVGKLMSLESTILAKLQAAKETDSHEYISILEKRLVFVRDRIDKAFLTE